jgi:group I intron endonuclease
MANNTEVNGLIYVVKNKINGKCYVGQTIQKWPQRKNEHHSKPHPNSAIEMAIKKYGKENFSWKVIEQKITNQNHLNLLEKFYIIYYNSSVDKWGYNIREGGSHGRFSEETRKKMSKSHKGGNNSMWGRRHPKKTIEKMSKAKYGKHPGATFDKRGNPEGRPWQCRISFNRNWKSLGYYQDPITASLIHDLTKKAIGEC